VHAKLQKDGAIKCHRIALGYFGREMEEKEQSEREDGRKYQQG
jgi:hypothetical protein